MSTVFLFGAGASYGSGDCFPEPPPLGAGGGLFRALQKAGGVAASINQQLSELFIKDFESGMAEFFTTRNIDVTAFLREMGAYFTQFKPGPSNLYRIVIDLLAKTKRKAVLSTTNYELLVELAINQAGYNVNYSGFSASRNTMPVLKIHGSCNFFPSEHIKISNINFLVSEGFAILNTGIRIAKNLQEVSDFYRLENSVAPAISMYARGKSVLYGPSFIAEQQKAWQLEIERASRIYVIGLRVNCADAHIWNPLKSSKAPLYYVGQSEDFIEWKEDVRRKQAYVIATTFAESIEHIKRHLKV